MSNPATTTRLYACVIHVQRTCPRLTLEFVECKFPFVVLSIGTTEAWNLARAEANRRYPEDEQWEFPSITVDEIPASLIRTAFAALPPEGEGTK